MGIRAGSGRGSADIGGSKGNVPGGVGSSRKRDKRLPIQPPPKKPLKPVESPFPQKPDFRLGQYRVIEERDDYLLCTGFDPNAKNPLSEVTPSAFRTGSLMKVAKPPALQRTVWEAGPVTIGGIEYTYEYEDDEFGVRTARWTKDGAQQEEEQRIDPPYTVDSDLGDIIVAVQIRKNAAVDGMEVEDEEGTRLRWIDLNVSGRRWKTVDAVMRYAKLTASLAAASAFLTGATTASAVFVKEDPANPSNLIADTRTLTVTNRWVDLSLDSGKYVVVQKIGDEWVIIASECP